MIVTQDCNCVLQRELFPGEGVVARTGTTIRTRRAMFPLVRPALSWPPATRRMRRTITILGHPGRNNCRKTRKLVNSRDFIEILLKIKRLVFLLSFLFVLNLVLKCLYFFIDARRGQRADKEEEAARARPVPPAAPAPRLRGTSESTESQTPTDGALR